MKSLRTLLTSLVLALTLVTAAWATVPTCTITGQVLNPDSTAFANGQVVFTTNAVQVVNGTTINPMSVVANTDTNGNISSISLAQGLVVSVALCKFGACGASYPGVIPVASTATFGNISAGTIFTPGNANMAGGKIVNVGCPTNPADAMSTGCNVNGTVNPAQYGCVCDDTVTDNTTCLANVFASGFTKVEVPASCAGHTYKFTTTETLGDSQWLECAAAPCQGTGGLCTGFNYTGTGTAFSAGPSNGNEISNCLIKTTTAVSGTGIRWNVNKGWIVGNEITGFGTGIDMTDGPVGGTQDNYIVRNNITTGTTGSLLACDGATSETGIGIKMCGSNANHGVNANVLIGNEIDHFSLGIDCERINSDCVDNNVFGGELNTAGSPSSGNNVTFVRFWGARNLLSGGDQEGTVTGTSYAFDTTGGSGHNSFIAPDPSGISGATAIYRTQSTDQILDATTSNSNGFGIYTGTSATITASSTDYIANGQNGGQSVISSQANAQAVWARPGVASNLQCFTTTACQAGGVLFQVFLGGVGQSLECTCNNTSPGAGTLCSDVADTFNVLAGSQLSIKVINSNAANATGVTGCAFMIH